MKKSHEFSYLGTVFLCSLLFLGNSYQVKAEGEAGPLEIIVPFGPGGGADQLARIAAPRLEEILNKPVEVTNIPGATGVTGIFRLLEKPADGNTLAVLTADTFSLLALTPPPWKREDIEPLAVMIRQPSGLFVAADGRFKTWKDFEEEAKARPYQLKVAVTGDGSPDDITVNYLASKGIRLSTANYDYPENRYQAVLSGKVDALYEQAGDIRAFLDERHLRPILFFADSAPPEFTDVPTSVEQGYDITIQQFRAFVIKGGTDPQKVKQLTDAVSKLAETPGYQAYLEAEYALNDSYLSRQEALAFMEKELKETERMVGSLLYMPDQFKVQSAEPAPCEWGAANPCLELDFTKEKQ